MDLLAIVFGGVGFGACVLLWFFIISSGMSVGFPLVLAAGVSGFILLWGLIKNHKSHTRK